MGKRIITLVALTSLVLGGCETVSKVEPGPYAPNDAYQVSLDTAWTAYLRDRRTRSRGLTIDGSMLNQLTFVDAIPDGGSLVYTAPGDREKLVPKFASDMGAFEIVEFVSDSLAVLGLVDVATTDVAPASFDGLDGVEFQFSGARASGLEYSGLAKAAVEEGALHLIIYYAPSEYYFDLHREEVENIMASVTLLD